MIAQIALKQKTKDQFQLFSYKVPAELLLKIKAGQIVLVDFSGKKKLGVVVGLSPRKRLLRKKGKRFKLKSLKKIIQPQLRIQDWQLRLARYIADRYAVSFGQALWSLLPPLSQRLLDTRVSPRSIGKKDTFQLRYLFGSKLERWRKFQKINQRHPAIFIFPQLQQARLFIQKFCPDCEFFHSDLPPKKQTQIYLDCLSKDPKSVAGTFSALFLPTRTVVVIEDFLSTIYQKDSSPRYEVVDVAKRLAQFKKIPMILADDSPPFWQAEPLSKSQIKIEIGSNLTALLEKNLAGSDRHLVWHPFENPNSFSLPHSPIDSVHLVFPNSFLSLPDYRLREEIFYLIKRALNLSIKQVIIYLQEEAQKEKIRQIFKSDFKAKELQARKRHRFPPFWELIKIDFRGQLSEDKLKKIGYNIRQGVEGAQIIDQRLDKRGASFILKAPRDVDLDYSQIYPGIVSRNLKKIAA
jgi:primosomal protein N'